MLYAVSCTLPPSCHSFAFLEWWRHLLATSSWYFFTTPTQISNVIRTTVGVWCLKCSTATVKDSKCAMMSVFPPSCSRGQKFIPVTSTQRQRPSFTFTNRGIKRDRSQTIRVAPGSFTAAEPPLGRADCCPDNLMSLCQTVQYSVWSV